MRKRALFTHLRQLHGQPLVALKTNVIESQTSETLRALSSLRGEQFDRTHRFVAIVKYDRQLVSSWQKISIDHAGN